MLNMQTCAADLQLKFKLASLIKPIRLAASYQIKLWKI